MRPLQAAKRNQKSIFNLTILVFLIIVTCILLLGFSVFIKSREIMIHQYTQSVQNQISIYFAKLDSELESIRILQENLITDSDVQYMKNRNIQELDFDLVGAINRVITQIKNMQVGNTYVDSVSVHFTEFNRTLGTDRDSFRELDRTRLKKISEAPGKSIKYYDNQLHMVTVPLNMATDYENSTCCVESLLKTEAFLSNIDSFRVSTDATSALMFEEFDFLLSSDPRAEDMYSRIDPAKANNRVTLLGKNYLILTYYSHSLKARYMQFIPERTAFKEIDGLTSWYLFFGTVVILTVGIYGLAMHRLLKKPIDVLINAFRKVQGGDFQVNITHRQTNEFGVIYESFNKMVVKIKHLIDDVYVQKILAQKAELRQLQAQINPHFLYNSFFILKKRISGAEYDLAIKFAEMLGLYFNYITKNYSDNTSLSKEVSHAMTYAEIQGIRFKDRITIVFDPLPARYENLTMPRLILQPILENAFKYGLEDLEFDGILRVRFEEIPDYLLIIIEDNSDGFSCNEERILELQSRLNGDLEAKEISGLLNIHRRMQLFSGDPGSGLSLEKSELGGLKATLRISVGN